jgi:hypothetical protein
MLLLSLLAPLVQFACIAASPAIRFGKTTLVGLDIPTFQQDLFAGPWCAVILTQIQLMICSRYSFRGTSSWQFTPQASGAEDISRSRYIQCERLWTCLPANGGPRGALCDISF